MAYEDDRPQSNEEHCDDDVAYRDGIVAGDSVRREATVKAIQEALGMEGKDVDGMFGKNTSAEVERQWGDVTNPNVYAELTQEQRDLVDAIANDPDMGIGYFTQHEPLEAHCEVVGEGLAGMTAEELLPPKLEEPEVAEVDAGIGLQSYMPEPGEEPDVDVTPKMPSEVEAPAAFETGFDEAPAGVGVDIAVEDIAGVSPNAVGDVVAPVTPEIPADVDYGVLLEEAVKNISQDVIDEALAMDKARREAWAAEQAQIPSEPDVPAGGFDQAALAEMEQMFSGPGVEVSTNRMDYAMGIADNAPSLLDNILSLFNGGEPVEPANPIAAFDNNTGMSI